MADRQPRRRTNLPQRRTNLVVRLRRDYPLLLMTAPALILLLLFVYIPLLGNVFAFMDYIPWIPLQETPWVGWANFERLFAEQAFWNSVVNTLIITALNILLFFPLPILLAVFLNSLLRPALRSITQAVIYLPHFLSWVIVVGFFQQVLGGAGVVNTFLQHQGVTPINFLGNPDTFKLLLTSQVIWKDAGWGTIIFLSALAGIDENLYEACAMDGGGAWRRFWHITLPGIRPIIILLLILRLGDALNVGFEQILLQRDGVGAAAAEVVDTYVYFNGVVGGDFSLGIAAGLFKGVVGLILIVGANWLAHAFGEEGLYSSAR